MKKFFIIFFLLISPALAQVTQQAVTTEILTNIFPNGRNEISGQGLQNTLNLMTTSIFQNQGLNGFSITGTPSIGQTIIATSPSTGTWQTAISSVITGSATVGHMICIGPITTQAQDCIALANSGINVPASLFSTKSIVDTGAMTNAQTLVNFKNAVSGTCNDARCYVNLWQTTDTVNNASATSMYHNWWNSTVQCTACGTGRFLNAMQATIASSGVTTPTNPQFTTLAVSMILQANLGGTPGNTSGGVFTFNPQMTVGAGASHINGAGNTEFDLAVAAGVDYLDMSVIGTVLGANHRQAGTRTNVAFYSASQAATTSNGGVVPPFDAMLQDSAFSGFPSNSTIFRCYPHGAASYGASGNCGALLWGMDFSQYSSITNAILIGPQSNGKIDGNFNFFGPMVSALIPVQSTSSVAGRNLLVTASDAVAGSTTPSAARGGDLDLTGGDAASFTAGVANGGDVVLTGGIPRGAAGSKGGNIKLNGGTSSTISNTSIGGDVIANGGVGIAVGVGTANNGGALTFLSGAGGASSVISGTGGASGATSFGTASGGAVTIGATSATGGASSDTTILTGAGGAAPGTGGTGGASGNIRLSVGTPGVGASANGTPGSILMSIAGTTQITVVSTGVTFAGPMKVTALQTGTPATYACFDAGGNLISSAAPC